MDFWNNNNNNNRSYTNPSSGNYIPVSLLNHDDTTITSSSTTASHDNNTLTERLVESPPSPDQFIATNTTTQVTPMIQLVAPANLPEGYSLPIQWKDHDSNNNNDTTTTVVTITIPPGGVEQGQTFTVPMPIVANTSAFPASSTTTTPTTTIHIPVGHWRDTLWDFFQYGPCHPHCWTSWLCTFLATGQVIRRLGLDWTGGTTTKTQQKAQAFSIILTIVVVYMIIHFVLLFVVVALDPEDPEAARKDPNYVPPEPTMTFVIVLELYKWWHLLYWILSTIVLIRTRKSLRQKYGIPVTYTDKEDILCAICCHCCVAAQMLRHTTDYNIYPSYLCTDTGLPSHAPSIV